MSFIRRKALAVMVIVMLVVSLAACGTGSVTTTTDGDGTLNEGPWKIAYDNMGTDWILMKFQSDAENAVKLDNPDNKFLPIAADYSTDKMQSGIQSMISSGVNGLVYYGIYQTLTPTVQELCDSAGTAYVMFHMPPTTEQEALLQNSPNFAGFIGNSNYEAGYQLGEMAAQKGGKVAVVIAGPIGTPDMDAKQKGFTEAFEKGGGKVVADEHCNFPTEAVEKSANMISAHPDVDTAYAATGVFGVGMISALGNAKRTNVDLYCSDLDADLLKDMRQGKITAGDGGLEIEAILATTLLLNKLDGKAMLDESGKPPICGKMPTLLITAENCDQFEQDYIAKKPFTDEMLKKFLYRYNSEVSWQDYLDFIASYNLDWFHEQQNA